MMDKLRTIYVTWCKLLAHLVHTELRHIVAAAVCLSL